jgi:hypothetical protein
MITVRIKNNVFSAKTLPELRTAFESWRDENGFGSSDIGGGWRVNGHPEVVQMSYNGRFWNKADEAVGELIFDGDVVGVPKSRKQADYWLKSLWNSEFQFHIDDSPESIFVGTGDDAKPLFDYHQSEHIRECLEACTSILGDWGAVWDAYFLSTDECENKGLPTSGKHKI